MNKGIVTNAIAVSIVVTGLIIEGPLREPILTTGLFTLAGGVTNWLAIYMLFEKVPGLYGSGVISTNFKNFKSGIHSLIIDQFFSKENLDRFIGNIVLKDTAHNFNFRKIIDETDLGPTYDGLVSTIMESSFGGMLSILGGQEALTPLKEPFIMKIRASLNNMVDSESFQDSLRTRLDYTHMMDDIQHHVEHVVTSRLNELTPIMVKDIIQNIMQEHLGWLVVWGGVLGGLIGLITSQLLM
ncbi:MAG: DUF445 domain-containing protein [Piscirickettsiaceae bacterium]|nr:DUF445 domain-containing protein [Piscirickettsiaceae bacterium]